MYWYGWMLTSLFGAAALASIASIVLEQWVQRAIFFGCLAAVGYLIFYTLALLVYDEATVELGFLKSRWFSKRPNRHDHDPSRPQPLVPSGGRKEADRRGGWECRANHLTPFLPAKL
jgi:hypothetical protein